jgi:hypothetical protein
MVDVFCARCGEKQPNHHDLTMGHLAHEVVHELVHLDSKLFRTLRDLVLKPGELTVAYFAGRKTRYIGPLRIFLTLFALQFLAYTVYKPVALYSMDGFLKYDTTGAFATKLKRAAEKRNLPYEQLKERIEHRWQKNISLLNLANIVALAFVLKLLYARRRRYLAEHMVFAAHFLSFGYLMSLVIWPVYLVIGLGRSTGQNVMMVLTMATMCFYLFLGLRRFYQQSKGKTFAKTLLAWGGTWLISLVLFTGALIGAILQVL